MSRTCAVVRMSPACRMAEPSLVRECRCIHRTRFPRSAIGEGRGDLRRGAELFHPLYMGQLLKPQLGGQPAEGCNCGDSAAFIQELGRLASAAGLCVKGFTASHADRVYAIFA